MTLRRVRPTPPQTELSRSERFKNVAGAFDLRMAGAVKGKRVLLVDDVCTTGATLRECGRVLRDGGALEVKGMVLARA